MSDGSAPGLPALGSAEPGADAIADGGVEGHLTNAEIIRWLEPRARDRRSGEQKAILEHQQHATAVLVSAEVSRHERAAHGLIYSPLPA